MATDTPLLPTTTSTPEPDGVLIRAALQLRQIVCGLQGHDSLMHFERGHISLVCANCGHESPGWDVDASPARRESGEKPRVVSLPLVGERRAA